jgi:hypothetical protein
MTELGVRYPITHDVAELVRMVELHDEQLPATPIRLSRLTAFAVQFRYDELPESLALDPIEARRTVAILRQHVINRLDQIVAKQQPPSI